MVAFDIGNTGVDGSSTSILLTPVYIQVIKIELTNTGSDEAKAVTKRTRMFPIVSSEAFEKIVKDPKNKEYLSRELFPAGEIQRSGGQKVPRGLEHLYDLIRASEQSLGGVFLNKTKGRATATFQKFEMSSGTAKFVDFAHVNQLIGSGTHGQVYSLRDHQNAKYCLKASRAGELFSIERELISLRSLTAGGADTPDQIPRLLSMGRLQLSIRKSTVAIPAFLFEPRGVVATIVFQSFVGDELEKFALKAWKDISTAMEYSHRKKIFQLDCRPPNIIYDKTKNVFVLGDWSSSAVIVGKAGIKGFRGALSFASSRVHQLSFDTSWTPQPNFEKASLGFTIVALIVKESVPWSGFSERIRDPDDPRFGQRREIASRILKERSLEAGSLGEILESFDGKDNKH